MLQPAAQETARCRPDTISYVDQTLSLLEGVVWERD